MSSTYIDIITERASSDAYDPAFPFKDSLLSAEAHRGLSAADMFSYVRDHSQDFHRRLKRLSLEQREMMIEYFILRKTDVHIAAVHFHSSQGKGVSEEINRCVRIILDGTKNQRRAAGMERSVSSRTKTFRDPAILGEFEINLSSAGVKDLFKKRAGEVSNASAL